MDEDLAKYLYHELDDLERRFEEIEVYESDKDHIDNTENMNDALMRLRELKSRVKRVGDF